MLLLIGHMVSLYDHSIYLKRIPCLSSDLMFLGSGQDHVAWFHLFEYCLMTSRPSSLEAWVFCINVSCAAVDVGGKLVQAHSKDGADLRTLSKKWRNDHFSCYPFLSMSQMPKWVFSCTSYPRTFNNRLHLRRFTRYRLMLTAYKYKIYNC